MSPVLSIWLDACRILAAFAVFLGHGVGLGVHQHRADREACEQQKFQPGECWMHRGEGGWLGKTPLHFLHGSVDAML